MKYNNSICAGIVTYNPDTALLAKSLDRLLEQRCEVWVFDNGSTNQKEVSRTIEDANGKAILNDKNIGIAAALNCLLNSAKTVGYEWMLALDQDSVIPDGGIESYVAALDTADSNTGIISCQVFDRNESKLVQDWTNDEEVILSGSLFNLMIWESLGGFDEYLFIDSVDTDYCYRLTHKGYKIKITQEITLDHSIGQSEIHTIFGRKTRYRQYSAQREYYQIRNSFYLYLKENNNGINSIVRLYLKAVWHILLILLYSDRDKGNRIAGVLKGLKEGSTQLKAIKQKGSHE